MTISEFLNLCKKRMYLVILIPLFFGAVTAFICWNFLPNEYTNSVSLYVLQSGNNANSANTNNNNNNNNNGQNNGITSSEITTSQQLANDMAVLAKSNRVKNAVQDEMGITDLDSYSVKVSSTEKNRVITLSVTGNNPNSVAQVVNCIARQTSALAVEVTNVDAVNIIEEAQPNPVPSGPKRALITLIAVLVGLCVAIAIIIIGDMLNTKVKSEQDIKETFDVPVLAHIPQIK